MRPAGAATGWYNEGMSVRRDEAAGYSKKPLAERLGLADGTNIVLNAPDGYEQQLHSTHEVTLYDRLQPDADFIQAFYDDAKKLENDFENLKKSLKLAGQLWISWPKRTSQLATDLDDNAVRTIGLAHGLVDVKVAAIDEDWSGLKFVFRLKDR